METIMPQAKALTIGDLAARTGLSVSAIRFYEDKGLVEPFRSAGGQRSDGQGFGIRHESSLWNSDQNNLLTST